MAALLHRCRICSHGGQQAPSSSTKLTTEGASVGTGIADWNLRGMDRDIGPLRIGTR